MRSGHVILCRAQPKTTAHPLRHILTTAPLTLTPSPHQRSIMGTQLPPLTLDSRRASDTCAYSRSFQVLLEPGGHRAHFKRFASATELAGVLVVECHMKSAGQQRTIGFQQWAN